MSSVDPKAANAARDARMADKKALSGALEDRIDGLAKFIKELKGIRSNLGHHIARVNKVYGDKYQANLNDQTSASAALHDLSLDFTAPHNIKLNPIQQVQGFGDAETKDSSATADESTDAAPAANNETAPATLLLSVQEAELREVRQLRSLRQEVSAKAKICKESGCAAAYQDAFELYKLGWRNNQKVRAAFNKENRTLGEFRRKLAALIAKKTAKMAKLKKQLSDLNKAIAKPDPPLSDLFPLIGQHFQEFTKVCTNFAKTSADGKAAMQTMLTMLSEPVVDDIQGGDSNSTELQPSAESDASAATNDAAANATASFFL